MTVKDIENELALASMKCGFYEDLAPGDGIPEELIHQIEVLLNLRELLR